mmetsp:Transcript_15406/g.53506  ORF Transcript_15406/g.53506 Transcript_15406/m.53506 type:complete len:250 (+) Transcript_15406:111-860(+)
MRCDRPASSSARRCASMRRSRASICVRSRSMVMSRCFTTFSCSMRECSSSMLSSSSRPMRYSSDSSSRRSSLDISVVRRSRSRAASRSLAFSRLSMLLLSWLFFTLLRCSSCTSSRAVSTSSGSSGTPAWRPAPSSSSFLPLSRAAAVDASHAAIAISRRLISREFCMFCACSSIRLRRSCMRSLKLATRSSRIAAIATLSRAERRLGSGVPGSGSAPPPMPPNLASCDLSAVISPRRPSMRPSYSEMW